MSAFGPKGSLIAGSLAAVGASACCVGPLVLLGLGIGGTWVGSLTAMEPVRPVFIGLTVAFLALAWWRLYRVAPVCEPGKACADPRVSSRQRIVFWVVSVTLAALIALPAVAPLIL